MTYKAVKFAPASFSLSTVNTGVRGRAVILAGGSQAWPRVPCQYRCPSGLRFIGQDLGTCLVAQPSLSTTDDGMRKASCSYLLLGSSPVIGTALVSAQWQKGCSLVGQGLGAYIHFHTSVLHDYKNLYWTCYDVIIFLFLWGFKETILTLLSCPFPLHATSFLFDLWEKSHGFRERRPDFWTLQLMSLCCSASPLSFGCQVPPFQNQHGVFLLTSLAGSHELVSTQSLCKNVTL